MRQRPNRFGLTLIEAIVVLVVIAVILGIVAVSPRSGRRSAKSLKDKNQITYVHKAMLAITAENNGRYPTPGLLRANVIDGKAKVDFSMNHSAPFYSSMIASNLFTPELLFGATEISPAVRVKDDYNYNAYNPAAGSFWDPTFQVRIDDPKIGSNTSYAHLSHCGDKTGMHREATSWRNSQISKFAAFGTRGPRDGATTGPEYDRSPTLLLHVPRNQWVGNIVFEDNHAETLNTLLVKFDDANGKSISDNLFRVDFPNEHGNRLAADSFLGIFIGSTEFTVDPIYDPLD